MIIYFSLHDCSREQAKLECKAAQARKQRGLQRRHKAHGKPAIVQYAGADLHYQHLYWSSGPDDLAGATFELGDSEIRQTV